MKLSKLYILSFKFESIKMNGSELFSYFDMEWSDNMNSCLNLGERISKYKVVKKKLKYLSQKFRTKIAIEV